MRNVIMVLVASAFFFSNEEAKATHKSCFDRKSLTKIIKLVGEKPTSIGLTVRGQIMEIFTSPKGNWTIVITHPNGMSCVVSTGTNWENQISPNLL